MLSVKFRFYEELNDYLPEARRKTDFEQSLQGKRSIKDTIEALGVPPTEVDLILVNGQSVDFNYILDDGDRVSVYPVFESLNIKGVTRLRKFPLRTPRFIADVDLEDLAGHMRTLGFDVYYNSGTSPETIIEISNKENRIILTKSQRLLKRKEVTRAMHVGSGSPHEKIRKILDDLDIRRKPMKAYFLFRLSPRRV
jgi:sulfur carrier protein ThiS